MSEQVIRDTVNIHTAHHLVMKEATLVSSMKTGNIHTAHHLVMKEATLVSSMKTGNIHTAHHLVMKEATLVSSTNTQFRINKCFYTSVLQEGRAEPRIV